MNDVNDLSLEDYQFLDALKEEKFIFPEVTPAIERVSASNRKTSFVPVTLDEARNALGERDVFRISVNALKNLVGRGSHETIKRQLEILKDNKRTEYAAESILRQERLQWAQKFEALVMAALLTRDTDFAQASLKRKSRQRELIAANAAAAQAQQLSDAKECIYGLQKSLESALDRECALRLRIDRYELFEQGAIEIKLEELSVVSQKLYSEFWTKSLMRDNVPIQVEHYNPESIIFPERVNNSIVVRSNIQSAEDIDMPLRIREPQKFGSIVKQIFAFNRSKVVKSLTDNKL